METTISRLLRRYETGKWSRREVVAALAMVTARSGGVMAADLQGTQIHHVSLQVRDLDRSRDFYKKILGLSVISEGGPENTVQLGQGNGYFLVLRKGNPAPEVDHFAIGLEAFDKGPVTDSLNQQGITAIDESIGAGFHVKDPDGFSVQIVAARR